MSDAAFAPTGAIGRSPDGKPRRDGSLPAGGVIASPLLVGTGSAGGASALRLASVPIAGTLSFLPRHAV